MIPVHHVPGLILATSFSFGGLWPLWNPKGATEAFGLSERIANSPEAQSVFTVYSSRMTVIGLAIYIFYYRKMYSAIDVLLFCLGWAGVVDGYICWKEHVRGKAMFRLVSSLVVAVMGGMGVTEG